jgi:hypothetical protein
VLLMPAKMNKAGQPAAFFPSRLAVFHSREILDAGLARSPLVAAKRPEALD